MKVLTSLLLSGLALLFANTATAAESLSLTAPKVLPREHRLSSFSPAVRIRLDGLEPGREYVVRLWLLEAESGSYHLASTQSPWAFRITLKDEAASVTHVETHDVFGYDKFLYVARLYRNGNEVASDTQPATGLASASPVLSPVARIKVKAGEVAQFQASARAGAGQGLEYQAIGLPVGATLDEKTGQFRWIPATPGDYRFTITATQKDGLGDSKKVNVEVTE